MLVNLWYDMSMKLLLNIKWSDISDPSPMEIRMALMSGAPSDEIGCLVAVICLLMDPAILKGEPIIAFWRLDKGKEGRL